MPPRVLRERLIDLEVPDEDVARGRALRKSVPRRTLAQLTPSEKSATEILVAQNAGRLHDLVPLRFARMLADPFSFYRGSAAVMAADLGASPSSGIEVMCCGDAHVSNFGMYAAPHRSIVFDLNDFDEAAVAPAEWDVKRLITSAIVGGRHAGYPARAIRRCVGQALVGYRTSLQAMLAMDVLDRYYLRVEPERHAGTVSKGLLGVIQKTTSRARSRTSARVFKQLTEIGPDGTPRLREAPPLLQHVDEDIEAVLMESIQEYLATVPADIALLLSHFRVTDVALRVVGVGSVGTRCYLVILVGPNGTPLILQIKEATRSVLDEYGGWPQPAMLAAAVEAKGQGMRVVDGQRILQAMSDVFLGPTRKDGRDYYVRQFHDMKGTVDTEGMAASTFSDYVTACAVLLARAHSQSANASLLRGYVGTSDIVHDAVTEWCYAYADKSLDDFHQLRAAAAAGDIEVAADPAR
ncbi:DUF2252 domain-containing protein [Mycobacterium nebraskense]|uniref:DUF2252 domain-containing protein n=1 Tax=Mycobacterium nebraskense TaxID=244292 RepID=A0A1X1ZWQ9_9MYCO|nr:DUF2252 domain-containing protein [Mycobacterium nebraskense]KKC05197.1 hypothetical protein WU83_09665 [Mycobacterium nebraskense]MBI2693713.1 DUF2252 domain-containing protein [Mycobacterium nebraskense]MCV7118531.1 DUF2252 domain-containing protein [Mycobacterium nebraskense]ORW28508.1 hypothetical protein AWC17_28255 [Mycobacterium nebraskense]